VIKHEAYLREKLVGYTAPVNIGPCSVSGCNKLSICKGMCRKHYTRFRKYGDTSTVKIGKPPLGSRIYKATVGSKEYYSEIYTSNKLKMSYESSLRYLKKRISEFGLTMTQYEELQKQGCIVCGTKDGGYKHRLHLDHDHTTGKFRGMLCGNCNTALGLLNDDYERIIKLSKYLKH
jgi:hypothetical protein